MSIIVKERITDWIFAYHKEGEELSADDIMMICDQIELDVEGDSWDYEVEEDGCKLIVVYKGL